MYSGSFKILLVEAEEKSVGRIRQAFYSSSLEVDLAFAGCLGEARDYLTDNSPDMILSALDLPDGKGTDLLPENERDISIPFVFLISLRSAEHEQIEARPGVMDMILKTKRILADIARITKRALREWRYFVALREAERKLRLRDGLLHSIIESVPNLIPVKAGNELRCVIFNRADKEFLGQSRSELLSQGEYDILPEEEAKLMTTIDSATPGKNADITAIFPWKRYRLSRKICLTSHTGLKA